MTAERSSLPKSAVLTNLAVEHKEIRWKLGLDLNNSITSTRKKVQSPGLLNRGSLLSSQHYLKSTCVKIDWFNLTKQLCILKNTKEMKKQRIWLQHGSTYYVIIHLSRTHTHTHHRPSFGSVTDNGIQAFSFYPVNLPIFLTTERLLIILGRHLCWSQLWAVASIKLAGITNGKPLSLAETQALPHILIPASWIFSCVPSLPIIRFGKLYLIGHYLFCWPVC